MIRNSLWKSNQVDLVLLSSMMKFFLIAFVTGWDSLITCRSFCLLFNNLVLKISVDDSRVFVDSKFAFRRRNLRSLRYLFIFIRLLYQRGVTLWMKRLIWGLFDSFMFEFCSSWLERASPFIYSMRLHSIRFLKSWLW